MKTRFHRLTGRFLGGLLCLLLALLGSSPVIAEKSVTVTFYHTDVLGSVIATSDEFGHLQWRRDYQPYGEIQLPRDSNDTDTRTNSLGYTGKPRDPNGLVYLGARYYDPLAGRFMAVDPAGIDAGNPHSFNRYAYAHNNPYKYVDPDGRTAAAAVALIAWMVGGAVISGGINAADQYIATGHIQWEGMGGVIDAAGEGAQLGPLGLIGARLSATTATRSVPKGLPEGAQYAQKTFNPMFSKGGTFAGQSVDDVAAALRSGSMKPSDVPIDYIMRDGRPLILNTRSSQALEAAGVPRSQWNAVNRTGQDFYEGQLNGQLFRNPGGPFDTVRRSGGN